MSIDSFSVTCYDSDLSHRSRILNYENINLSIDQNNVTPSLKWLRLISASGQLIYVKTLENRIHKWFTPSKSFELQQGSEWLQRPNTLFLVKIERGKLSQETWWNLLNKWFFVLSFLVEHFLVVYDPIFITFYPNCCKVVQHKLCWPFPTSKGGWEDSAESLYIASSWRFFRFPKAVLQCLRPEPQDPSQGRSGTCHFSSGAMHSTEDAVDRIIRKRYQVQGKCAHFRVNGIALTVFQRAPLHTTAFEVM